MQQNKTLIIARHGKSSWDYLEVSDIDRPLKERGIKNVYEIAEKMLNRKIIPEMIISSPACRAIHTAIIFMRVMSIPDHHLLVNSDIYHADVDDLMKIINQTNNDIRNLMIVGHNPTFTELVNYLSDLGISNIPTAGSVILEFKISDWKDIDKKNYYLGIYEFPGK